MAGNTKLIGFGKDIKNPGKYILKLARWGGEIDIEIDREMAAKLEHACRENLPTKPKQSEHLGPNFKATYDPAYGVIGANFTIETAQELAATLSCFAAGVLAPLKKGARERLMAYSKNLCECVQDHKDYLIATEEPGVEDTN